MSEYLKPQSPIQLGDKFIYPLTTVDQVIMEDGNRLNTVFKSTVRKTVTLLANNWSADVPYTQTITFSNVNFDDLKVDAHVAYTGNKESDLELNKGYACISYVKKDGNSITFSCLKDKPTIDMPVEIVGSSCDSIATVEEGTKLNFDIVAYESEEELLADTPMENTIGVVTDTPISKWVFDSEEPENPADNMLWICVGVASPVEFSVIEDTDILIYPISAKQYVDGVWTDRVAKSRQNGEWVPWWNGKIYDKGNEFTYGTGGLQTLATIGGSVGSPTSHATKYESYIELYGKRNSSGGNHAYACVYTSQEIDLTRYERIVLKASENNKAVTLLVCDTLPYIDTYYADGTNNNKISFGIIGASIEVQSTGETILPIQNIDKGYVCVYLATAADTTARCTKITEIYCE